MKKKISVISIVLASLFVFTQCDIMLEKSESEIELVDVGQSGESTSSDSSSSTTESEVYVEPPSAPSGEIRSISSNGTVVGWGADPENPQDTLDIEFYIDGNQNTGQFIGSTLADRSGYNGGVAGEHAFYFTLPDEYKDRESYTLYAYLIINNQYIEVEGSQVTFSIVEASTQGITYFNETVEPLLENSCSSCHVVSHSQFFPSLINPSPVDNGSSSNNQMINMPLGSFSGTNHPGGNICGSINNSPCREIAEWWNVEFGSN